jgi:LacI family transcriptional regulator
VSKDEKISIADVANLAGVSVSSVSRALSGHPHVSRALRDRVEAAVRETGYHPHPLAQGLRTGSTRSVGFLVGLISNPSVAAIYTSAVGVLASRGYATLLVTSQNDPHLDVLYLQFLAERQVDGLIVSTAAGGPDQASSAIMRLGIPTVMLDRAVLPAKHVSAVQSDHVGGMRAAVGHLATQGHRRIALISAPDYFYLGRERTNAFRTAMKDAGLAIEPELLRSATMHESAAYAETVSLLRLPQPPTAIIAGGNILLTGVLQAMRQQGVAIGRDIALIGADDIDLARLYNPSITVISRDLVRVGESAAHLLLEAMSNNGGNVVTIPTRLIVRESSMRSWNVAASDR